MRNETIGSCGHTPGIVNRKIWKHQIKDRAMLDCENAVAEFLRQNRAPLHVVHAFETVCNGRR